MSAYLKKLVYGPAEADLTKYGRKYTPDILNLQQFKRHLVFLPCDMQKGKRNHSLVADAEPYGLGYTRRKFIMYKKNLGNESFPIPLPDPHLSSVPKIIGKHMSNVPARIRGELYFMNTETLSKNLDTYRLNGVEFIRELVPILFPYKEPYTQINRDTGVPEAYFSPERVYNLLAWMYVGIEEYWEPYLDCGYDFSPCKLHQSRKNWMDYFYEFR